MFLLISFLTLVSSEDYYKLLGVDKHADDKIIKKSFKKLSLEYHPDRGNKDTQDHYMKLSLAYEVLTNPAKREVYDKFGEEGITVGGLKYNVEEIYDNYFGVDYPGKHRWYNLLFRGSSVVELTEMNMNSLKSRNLMWIVQFYGSRSRKSREFTGVWNNLANRLEGFAKIAAVNCDINEDTCREYNVKKYPVIYIFPPGEDEAFLYTGSKDYRSINDFVLTNLPGKLESLTSSSFFQFLATEPDKPKFILFCENKETWPVVKQVALTFLDQAMFGEVRSNERELVRKYNVESFPSLIVVTQKGFELFRAPLQRRHLEDWVRIKKSEHVVVSFNQELDQAALDQGRCGKNDGKFCFLAFDPDLKMREVLNYLVQQFSSDPVSIFWVSSRKFPEVLKKLGSRNVIVRGKKQKFSPVFCSDEQGAECFVDALVGSLNNAREFFSLDGGLEIGHKQDL
jgi:curved DNA-binding protein CbpA